MNMSRVGAAQWMGTQRSLGTDFLTLTGVPMCLTDGKTKCNRTPYLLLILCILGIHGESVEQKVVPRLRAIKGSDSVIPCTSDVNGPPVQTIIWYFQHKEILRYDGEIRAVDPRYSLSTNRARDGTASLVISNITITDGGTYTCSLLYGQGKEDMEVTVFIQAPLDVRVTNNIVVRNQESVLRCSVNGFYPLGIGIKWLREGVLLHRINVGNVQTNPDGTYNVNTTATILPTEEDQDQTFSCSVQYKSQVDAFQFDFRLIFGVPPSLHISTQPFRLNKEQTLICRVWGFYPESVVVSWFLNGTRVEASWIERINSSAVESFYQFTPTVQLWGTEISCKVEHGTLPSPLVEKVRVENEGIKRNHRAAILVTAFLVTLLVPLVILIYYKCKKREQEEGLHLVEDLGDENQLNNSLASTAIADKGNVFEGILQDLEMGHYRTSQLTPNKVWQIWPETVEILECQTLKDVPWSFLRKLMSLNPAARSMTLIYVDNQPIISKGDGDQDSFLETPVRDLVPNVVHPLDLLCVLLHCSDPCLQQEIFLKMSMCQFAVPLLLPSWYGPSFTFMLWAMRDIVKKWRPPSSQDSKGFEEDNIVNISMPVFSFVRLGNCRTSKSRILNRILSPAHPIQDFFLHREMDSGNVARKISDGLVEISWYFPRTTNTSNVFQEPAAVVNMRGDIKSGMAQFHFLCQVSSAVFIFTEDISEEDYEVLLGTENAENKYFIIITKPYQSVREEMRRYLKLLNYNVLNNTVNDAALVEQIRLRIEGLNKSLTHMTLEQMAHKAGELGIQVDEFSDNICNLKTLAEQSTNNRECLAPYKRKAMSLDGDCWKELQQVERIRKQWGENGDGNKAKLVLKCFNLLTQMKCEFQNVIVRFLVAINYLTQGEKLIFLKWMKLNLDQVARGNHAEEYSLGVEDFLQMLPRLYEDRNTGNNSTDNIIHKLPGLGADLLHDGFPLQLVDGDASNIPMKWVTDVLMELNTKTGGKCRIRVISALEVLSTGKSTLLNSIFGLQLPVAREQGTQGAFMILINVKETFQPDLGCEFIVLIDTEGLNVAEMSSHEDKYELHSQLAEIVFGLSDITIINMVRETVSQLKGNLTQKFLKTKRLGRKKKCLFVHHNVSDVYFYKEEGDDPEVNTWYIPPLWFGAPPMASVSLQYSESVCELKKDLISSIKQMDVQNIQEFSDHMEQLFKSATHKNIIK
ncbi:up-regulator of cell proliferation isoform X2 [Xenopus tropicalis]|uniref:Up-regulator of cell proliferation isoform X2 n=1 Tax=Xenopus tropicalis TaxID=8364 RepID=A0A8J1IY82_XENTR|nr:up-regulator of cell proliferation isoform X2 [Xenopus tropicalis]